MATVAFVFFVAFSKTTRAAFIEMLVGQHNIKFRRVITLEASMCSMSTKLLYRDVLYMRKTLWSFAHLPYMMILD